MRTKIFDGKEAALLIKEEIKAEAERKVVKPTLAVILIGNNPASLSYIKRKEKACGELGFGFELHQLPENSNLEDVENCLSILSSQSSINGIILQLPLPEALLPATEPLINSISRIKDIDGLTPGSIFTPPTALAVIHVLRKEGVQIKNFSAAVLGRGRTSGGPIARLLEQNGARVSVIHSRTPPAESLRLISKADIIVSCVGKPGIIKGEMVKEGAVVIGVGISQLSIDNSQLRIVGDLDGPSLIGKASLITPTPGGIGPLTVAFLLKNLLEASKKGQN